MCKLHVASTSLQLRVRTLWCELAITNLKQLNCSCEPRTSSRQSHYEELAHKGLADMKIGHSLVLDAVSEKVIPSSRFLEMERLVVLPIGFCCHPPLSLAMHDGARANVHRFAFVRHSPLPLIRSSLCPSLWPSRWPSLWPSLFDCLCLCSTPRG